MSLLSVCILDSDIHYWSSLIFYGKRSLCLCSCCTLPCAHSPECSTSVSWLWCVSPAPCPPQAISANISCTSNIISVNWSSSMAGVSYMAQAVSSNGYYMCNTTNMFCSISVPCGRTYNISVIPSQNGCNGVSSPYKIIQAGQCGFQC